VQMNLLAAMSPSAQAVNQIYNVAVGDRTTLNGLYAELRRRLATRFPHLAEARPIHGDVRTGDVRHSQADISKAGRLLGYQPTHRIGDGLERAMPWYLAQGANAASRVIA